MLGIKNAQGLLVEKGYETGPSGKQKTEIFCASAIWVEGRVHRVAKRQGISSLAERLLAFQ